MSLFLYHVYLSPFLYDVYSMCWELSFYIIYVCIRLTDCFALLMLCNWLSLKRLVLRMNYLLVFRWFHFEYLTHYLFCKAGMMSSEFPTTFVFTRTHTPVPMQAQTQTYKHIFFHFPILLHIIVIVSMELCVYVLTTGDYSLHNCQNDVLINWCALFQMPISQFQMQ